MRRVITFIIALSSIFIGLSVTVSAAGLMLVDDAGLLSVSEENEILREMSDAEARIGSDIYLYTHDGIIYGGGEAYILRRLDLDYDDDAIVLSVYESSGTYYYELYTYGNAADISDSAVDRILDNRDVYDNIKAGNISEGLSAFVRALPEEIEKDEKSNLVGVIVVSVIIALASGGATVGIIIYKYKKKLKSPIYPLSKFANMDLDYSSDNFIGSTVTRVRVNNSSGSRGSSGGGGFRGKR